MQHRTVLHPVTIAEGITRHCVEIAIGRNKLSYELTTTVDGDEHTSKTSSQPKAVAWIAQAREDAAEYAADLDMQEANRRVVQASLQAAKRVARGVQLVMGF